MDGPFKGTYGHSGYVVVQPRISSDHGVYTSGFSQVLSKLWVFEVESSILGGYTVVGGFWAKYVRMHGHRRLVVPVLLLKWHKL